MQSNESSHVAGLAGILGIIHSRVLVASSAFVLLAGCNDGVKGELQTKEIYGDMSGLYYRKMCKEGSAVLSEARTRAIRVETPDGECAVLYLDGIDRQGNLLVYPGVQSARISCEGLVSTLQQNRANGRTVRRAKEFCDGR